MAKFKNNDRVRIHNHWERDLPCQGRGIVIGEPSDPEMGDILYSVLQKSSKKHYYSSHRCQKGCLKVTCEAEEDLSLIE